MQMNRSSGKSVLRRILYWIRDLRARDIFGAMESHCRGDVLDVGGWDFYLTARKKNVSYLSWTTLENSTDRMLSLLDPRFRMVHGDGCKTDFASDSFDTVLNLQVLEHVFEPMEMIQEIARVLKPGGVAMLLIPQTGNLHLIPHHYYNFTIFWIKEAMRRAGLEIMELKPLGGAWSTIASRLVYLVLQGAGVKSLTYGSRRPLLFYLMSPFMLAWVLINVPVCMFFSLADLVEEPNNHLVVVRK